MKKLMLGLVLMIVLIQAMPARAFLGGEIMTPDADADAYSITSDGWVTGLYVSRVECSSKLTVVYFTNGLYVYYRYYNSAIVLLAQNALYANRSIAIFISGTSVTAYRLQ